MFEHYIFFLENLLSPARAVDSAKKIMFSTFDDPIEPYTGLMTNIMIEFNVNNKEKVH